MLKVGSVYRGNFGTSVCWLRIEKIEIGKCRTTIYYRASDWKLPRWLSWFACPSTDTPRAFSERVSEVKRLVRELEVLWPKPSD